MAGIHLMNHGVDSEFFERVAEIVLQQLELRRCELCPDGVPVALRIDEQLAADEYRISAQGEIVAQSRCGILAGIGRYLREARFDGQGGFEPSRSEFALIPKKAIRGMYLATHFFNYYHAAPMDEMRRCIAEIALRGGNAIQAWYDMHHYTGIDDPHSVEMIERIKSICRYAKSIGMKICLCTLANEAFDGTPEAIRAEWIAQNGYKYAPVGHFHVEICPNKPGGMDEIIKQRRQMLRAFAALKVDFVSMWPYDQGGCTCKRCAPWGANGFLKIAPEFWKAVQEEAPGAKLLCGVWYLDHFVDGEWEAFQKQMATGKYDFFSYLYGYFFENEPIPEMVASGKRKMLGFPEISMRGSTPWGGFGANPLPAYLERMEKENGALYEGGFPYSEGIFEDINKSIMLGFASGEYDSVRDILRDYVKYEFGAEQAEDVVDILYDMEETLDRHRYDQNGDMEDYPHKPPTEETVYHFEIVRPEKIESIYERTMRADDSLPESLKRNWKWRIVYLRAIIDHELLHGNGVASDVCEDCYRELIELYHVQNGEYSVTPPTRESMMANRGGFLL